MAEFLGYFINSYSVSLAMAALNADVKSFDTDVTVVADRFTNYRKYNSDERDGKRLLVMTNSAARPFQITFPLTNDDGEELTFSNCHLKKMGIAHVTGLEAYVNAQRNQISFRAKQIQGVK